MVIDHNILKLFLLSCLSISILGCGKTTKEEPDNSQTEEVVEKPKLKPKPKRKLGPRILAEDDFEEGIVTSPTYGKYGERTGLRFHAKHPRLNGAYLGAADASGNIGAAIVEGDAASGNKAIKFWRGEKKTSSRSYAIVVLIQ